MKILDILNESDNKHIESYQKVIKVLEDLNVDQHNIKEIYNELTNTLFIENEKTLIDLVYLFNKYGYGMDNVSPEELNNFLNDIDVDDLEITIFGEHLIALSKYLGVNPNNIETYSELYGMPVLRNIETGEKYAIGDDDEANYALYKYYVEYIDEEGYNGLNPNYLKTYIKLDSYALDEEIIYRTENYIDEMTQSEKIEELGLEEETSNILLKLEANEDDMDKIYQDMDSLDTNDDDYQDMDSLDTNDDDYQNKIDLLKGKLRILKDFKVELEEEIESLLDFDKLYDVIYKKFKEEIEDIGVDYFFDMGYDIDDILRGVGYINDNDLARGLAEDDSNDRGNVLNYYSGEEDDIIFNNKYFFIYDLGD